MAVSANQLAEASQFNTVATTVNKVFGDNYTTAAVTDASRINTHKFGWGATNVANALSAGTSITATKLQDLVERANVSVDHINVTDSTLVFSVPTSRSNVTAATLVRAEDLNIVDAKFTDTILASDAHTTIDATNASALTATPSSGGPYTRTATWNNKLVGEHKWTWGSYNKARYFFNAGGQVRLSLAMSGGTTAGYYNWSDVINEMGVMNLAWNNFTQSNSTTSGTSQAKGFYNLTQYYGDGSDAGATNEGLLFTSNGVTLSRTVGDSGTSGSAYGYITGPGTFSQWGDWAVIGGTTSSTIYVSAYSAYSTYQNLRFKIYGKYTDSGAGVSLKFVLDDSAHANTIDGTTTPTLSYLMPDNITQGATTFSVTPAPTVSITNNLSSPDDY